MIVSPTLLYINIPVCKFTLFYISLTAVPLSQLGISDYTWFYTLLPFPADSPIPGQSDGSEYSFYDLENGPSGVPNKNK